MYILSTCVVPYTVDFVAGPNHPIPAVHNLGGEQTLSTLAALLAVKESALEAMLTQRVVVTRGETFTKQLGLDDANLTRDAIIKSLYEVPCRIHEQISLFIKNYVVGGEEGSSRPPRNRPVEENLQAVGALPYCVVLQHSIAADTVT